MKLLVILYGKLYGHTKISTKNIFPSLDRKNKKRYNKIEVSNH